MPRMGRKISCPAAFAELMMPTAVALRTVNQRFATAVASPMDPADAPIPTISPQVR